MRSFHQQALYFTKICIAGLALLLSFASHAELDSVDYDDVLMHAWIESALGGHDKTGEPDPVTGLRYDIYGATSAEVFWDRSDIALANYRIYFNGELLTQTDGVSWYSRNLPRGSDITIGVTALGPGGTESEVREVSFNTSEDDNEPETDCSVTGLRAAVYGSATAEIFWDRDSAGTRYNLTLDGTFLANTDAISWYSNSYVPSSTHWVTVKNADTSCDAAEAAVVEFDLAGSENRSGTPTKPGNLRADVYSRTAAELFWEPSSDDGWVIGYDILRDGNTVADALDAKSYFDNTLLAGENYTYTVAAIDNEGNRSEQATVSITTAGDKSSSLINRENHVEVISDMFAIYVGDTYTDPLDNIANFNITGRNEDFSFTDVFDCESGSFEQELEPTSSNAGTFFTFDFAQCVFDGKLHNGYVTGQGSARGLSFTTNQFSVREVETAYYAEYTGDIEKLRSESLFFDRIHLFETEGARIKYIDVDYKLLLEQMQTSFAYGSHSSGLDVAWLRGGFNTRLNTIDGPMIAASTPIEFSYKLNTRTDGINIDDIPPSTEPLTKEIRDNWTFTTGQLQIIAEDGSTLLLDADNGNPLTASITITSDKGVEIFEQPWSIWVDVLRFDRFPDLSG